MTPLDTIREFFSLAGARERVAARSPEVQARTRALWRAARERLRIAERLSPESEFAPALALYREGVTALVAAALVAVEGDATEGDVGNVRAAWLALERVAPRLAPELDLGEFRAARDALREPVSFESAPAGAAETLAASASLARLARLLERAIEPRTARQLRVASAGRKAGVTLAVAVALVSPVVRWLSPVDLALHRPVTMSSVLPSKVSASGGDLETGLVNGHVEYTYGAHTDNGEDAGRVDPWMMVDLERPTRIGRVVVYNRGDKNFTDCLPLILEAGNDPAALVQVATRDRIFTRTNPWVVEHIDATVRYVRVRKTGPGYIALSELEIYAR